MAVVWRYPLQPLQNAAGGAITAAALTASGINPLPQLPPVQIPGSRLSLRATLEVTVTSSTPTLTVGFYMGSVGQAIGSKAVLCTSAALALSASATLWPLIIEWDGTFRTLLSASGVIHGQGIATSWLNVGLTGAGVANPMPTTAAARTVSTNVNTSQVNEIDVGVTLSSSTGVTGVYVTDLWAELSG
jgi:hypothetical protein